MIISVGARRDDFPVEIPGDAVGVGGVVHPEGEGSARDEGAVGPAVFDIFQKDNAEG